jgi:PAS domain S-box-containing protein
MNCSINNRSAFGLGIVAGLLVFAAAISCSHTFQLHENEEWVTHTHQVLDTLAETLSALKDAETGVRGYVITGKRPFLEPYHSAVVRVPKLLDKLRALTTANPDQGLALASLGKKAAAQLALYDEVIRTRGEKGFQFAQKMVATGTGKRAMDKIRALVADMEKAEQTLLKARADQSSHSFIMAMVVEVGGTLLSLAALGVAAFLIHRELRARRQAEQTAHEQGQRLFTILVSIGDAVIVTNAKGRVTLMNPVAQALTGWKEEAAGRDLGVVFHIVNMTTRRQVESPVTKVLREGTVVGLANHTVLIAKDGTEVPIDDSGAPIRDPKGRITGVVLVFRDISEHQRAEETLRNSEARERARAAELEAIMSAAPAALWIAHDPECRHITGNPASYRLLRMAEGTDPFGTSPEEGPTQRPFREFRDGVPVPGGELPLQVAAALGVEVRGTDLALMFDDGDVRHIYGNAAPLREADGTVRGAIAAFIDITELKQADEALLEADQRKNEFLAMLAHELRNPLAPIRNALQVMRLLGPPDERLQWSREMIERQVGQLTRLVDDLLDVSRITRGQINLKLEPVDLAAVLTQVVEDSRPLIEERRHTLELSLPAKPVRVEGDLTRLVQVFSNLVNNAAKYTNEGGRIWLTLQQEDEKAVIRVKDNGIGMLPETLPKVFELFTQVNRGLDRSQGGLGIGLTLVRRLVEVLGGTVKAFSKGLGHGSEFVVHLPALVQNTAEAAPGTRLEHGASIPPRRVLVVDDKVDNAESLAFLLRLNLHEVRTAYDGQEALEAARDWRPEVILLDIGLPHLDGLEVARRLRHDLGMKEVLLVAMTGYGQEEDKRRSQEAGFNAHLVKPVDLDTLRTLLAEFVLFPTDH